MRADCGVERKQERYLIDPETGCWNWLLHVTTYGYGWLTFNGKTMHAHRREYEKRYGKIQGGKHLDHLCRNRQCVNPDHLELVSNTENVRRGNASKLDEIAVIDIRKRYANGEKLKVICKDYSICVAHGSKIVNGHSWVSEIESLVLTIRKQSSQYHGVSWNKNAGKWIASVSIKRKSKYLGLFLQEHNAAEAYNEAVNKYGLSCPLNSV